MTRQDNYKTRQDKTTTRQDKTRQDKTTTRQDSDKTRRGEAVQCKARQDKTSRRGEGGQGKARQNKDTTTQEHYFMATITDFNSNDENMKAFGPKSVDICPFRKKNRSV